MNLTMTRAEQTACAEPGIAERGLDVNAIDESARGEQLYDGHDHGLAPEDRFGDCPIQSESERFGLSLLGIGYDSSIV